MRLLAIALLVVLAWWALLFGLQRVVLFPRPAAGVLPPTASAQPPAASGPGTALAHLGGQALWLDAAGARVEAWLLPALRLGAEVAGGQGPRPLLLYAHGNGELIDHWLGAFEPVREWGVSVLLIEYPGYGRSGGTPSETSIRAALVAAYDWAVAQPGIDRERILGHGRSLGGGAICALSRERRLAALVLESTFTSVSSLARRFGLPGFLVRDPFDNVGAVRAFPGPVLLVHGERDAIVAPRHAQALRGATARGEIHLQPCGHDDCPHPWPLLRGFLDSHGLL